jgi:Cys-tRNA(Pro)/Cys-tRNA(Cys) deacylase
MHRTKALQLLTEKNIPHTVREFAATQFTAEEVAEKLHLPLNQVFKTLVAECDKKLIAALVPGTKELSLKKLASALGVKRLDLVNVADLPRLTGYLKGGVSPLGSKKPFRVVCDRSITDHEAVSVSAGLRGLQILIAPEALITVSGALVAPLTEE